MKKICVVLSLLFLVSCKADVLNPKEKALLKKLNFETELMILLKNETSNELKQLPAIDKETGDIGKGWFDGICSRMVKDDDYSVVKKLKEKFRAKGYLIFTFMNEKDQEYIAVIKGTDELDIVRYRRTDGINYNLNNEKVVDKLEKWKSKNDFNILVCGRDCLQFEFKTLPADLDAFSKDVYQFCPDIVDQGVGDIKNLKSAIKEMNGLYLWWD
jgi:hypothetical protein